MPDPADFYFTYWGWFTAALVLAVIEIIAPGIFMIWLAAAALVTGLATFVFAIGWELQLVIFGVFAVAAILVGRNYLLRNPLETTDNTLNRRGERLIGTTATVAVAIIDGRGKVQIGDSPWLATGPDTEIGKRVKIIGIDGATLLVEPV